MKKGAGETELVKFLREAAIMGQFHHCNVMQLYGVVTLGEPVSTESTILLIVIMTDCIVL